MELDKLKRFIKFMDDNNLCELEVEEKNKRIRLKKNTSNHPAIATPVSSNVNITGKKEDVVKENEIEIKSPMVGTFYRAPSPGAKPYTEIGEIIQPGDVVCIIEAMKLMNEIKAETGGKVVRISLESGEPVEFGQVLFVIEPV
ncbi:MAG: acetyl-CoA carboxylase biotin carboxyl carrier protein [Omnitrophica bacterium]|nr:acetyl-CoA carboxylase biotin carboxyl carrier protein [Candidatus Omnitrophota bacterium]